MKILVTGGSGFIGSALVGNFIELGHEVRVLDNGSRGNLQRLKKYDSHFEYIDADIRDSKKVDQSLKGIQVVFHLAFVNGTANFYRNPLDILDIALQGMQNILNSSSLDSLEQFHLASSSEVYQNPAVFPTPTNVPLVVPDVTNPRYSYGLGKIVQEFMLLHSRHLDIRKIIFRPHNIYGPDMGSLHVIPELFEKAQKTKDGFLRIKGDGSHTRSFCYISDFIEAINLIMTSTASNEIFNIGTTEEVSIRELALKILHEIGVQIPLEYSETPLGETSRRIPDISAIKHLGFTERVSLREGLKLYNSWLSSKGN